MARLVVWGPALSLEIGRGEIRNVEPFFEALLFGLLRAANFAAVGWLARSPWSGINFGILSAIGLVAAYLILVTLSGDPAPHALRHHLASWQALRKRSAT